MMRELFLALVAPGLSRLQIERARRAAAYLRERRFASAIKRTASGVINGDPYIVAPTRLTS